MGGHAAAKEGQRKGDFLGGKYLLEDCLGIGGMGEVYRATNVSLDRKVAIKLLNKEHTSNEDDVLRFLREARAAAAVRHPNVVDVFDVARDDDGTPFIVQELLSGEDLEQYLGGSKGRLGVAEALEIMIPVADAVAAAHSRNVVHRDLKPANIFLAREGNKIIPKVLDFGACLYQTVGALSAKERRMLIGTPHYMAPEQITTAMDVDVRADVWAIGVILYELLAGETPFEAEDANTVLKLVRTRHVMKLRKVAPAASESLEDFVACCLDRDRRKRFKDAATARDELEKVRDEMKGTSGRSRVDTPAEHPAVKVGSPEKTPARAVETKAKTDDDAPASYRVPSLVLRGGKPPTKRRGSALLTLSSPDEAVSWDSLPPASESRRIESQRPPRSEGGPKPARTAADVIRDADQASGVTRTKSSPPTSARAPLASSSPSLPPLSLPPSSGGAREARAKEALDHGRPRDLDADDFSNLETGSAHAALDLDLSPPPSRASGHSYNPGASSIPPVLDPRVAVGSGLGSDAGAGPDSTPDKSRVSRADMSREASLTPPLTPPLTPSERQRPRTPAAALTPEEPQTWTSRATATLAATILVPAIAAFVSLRFMPFVHAPLGHAMRGDSPLASGVLAILALVGAAVLASRALGSSRSPGMVLATVGAVLLGIVMIIVTFSASETADLGIPPAAGGVVAFIAPIIPIGLGLAAFARARSGWVSKYDRADGIKFAILTSIMLLALLELSPVGAIRAAAPATPATRTAAPATTTS